MPEVLPYTANQLDLDPVATDPLGIPVVRITFDIYDNEPRLMSLKQDQAADLLAQMGATRIWRTGFGDDADQQRRTAHSSRRGFRRDADGHHQHLCAARFDADPIEQ